MSRVLAAALSLSSFAAFASLPAATPIDTNAGDQTDPHVSSSRVAYTDYGGLTAIIRYYDLATGTGGAVPGSGLGDNLSDVSGNTVVFTRQTTDGAQRIFMWNWGDASASELAPQPGFILRVNAAIGAQTVAWEERTSGAPMIATHDLSTGTDHLVIDPGTNFDPAVSAAGDLVTWTHCNAGDCSIHSASEATNYAVVTTQATSVFSDSSSDTNGAVVVYDAQGASDRDIFVKTIGGGVTTIPMAAGSDTNPNIAGNLVAFEHFDPAAGSTDIWMYDIVTHALNRLTSSPADEFLNDISLDGTTVRVVFATPSATGDFDVYATTFSTIPDTCEPFPTNLSADDACAELQQHGTPIAQYTLTRTKGSPNHASAHTTASGRGIVCVGNHYATSATVKQNGGTVFGQSSFHHSTQSLSKYVTLTGSDNFASTIAGQPGTKIDVTVYALDDECAPPADDDASCDNDDGSHDGDHDHDDGDNDQGHHAWFHHFCHHHSACHSEPRHGHGGHHEHHSSGDSSGQSSHHLDSEEAGLDGGPGCASAGNSLAFWAVGIFALVALLRPRAAPVAVRRNRR